MKPTFSILDDLDNTPVSRLQLYPWRTNPPRVSEAHSEHEPARRWSADFSPLQRATVGGVRNTRGLRTVKRNEFRAPRGGSWVTSRAFTLIELLVVISIIAILAGFILPTAGAAKRARMIKVAQAELSQVQAAVEAYKAKLGFYPPDNPIGATPIVNPVLNPLYFELAGTVLTNITAVGDCYVTLDGTTQVPASPAAFSALFGANTTVSGFMNSSKNARGGDEGSAAINFLSAGLKPNQIGALQLSAHAPVTARILVCSVQWSDASTAPIPTTLAPAQPPYLNPWRYISSTPTNNTGSYDLWVDISINGKIYRVSNWSKQPQVF